MSDIHPCLACGLSGAAGPRPPNPPHNLLLHTWIRTSRIVGCRRRVVLVLGVGRIPNAWSAAWSWSVCPVAQRRANARGLQSARRQTAWVSGDAHSRDSRASRCRGLHCAHVVGHDGPSGRPVEERDLHTYHTQQSLIRTSDSSLRTALSCRPDGCYLALLSGLLGPYEAACCPVIPAC